MKSSLAIFAVLMASTSLASAQDINKSFIAQAGATTTLV